MSKIKTVDEERIMTHAEINEYVDDNGGHVSRFWAHVAGGDVIPMTLRQVRRALNHINLETEE